MEQIYVLGPSYSYSHNLACEHYSEKTVQCVPTIAEVFKAVAHQKNSKGIVPLENVINGTVRESFLNLKKYPVTILRAFDYHIENILAANSSKYTAIASHAQPLAQCSDFLETCAPVELIETSSTSTAMELARNDPTIAAIGNRKAAEHYGVRVRKTKISNKNQNITRFLEIGAVGSKKNGTGAKTSMMIRPFEDRAGILFEILSVFRIKNINLTKIESIPTGRKMDDYIFYIDIDGSMNEVHIQDAIAFLRTFVEVDMFGSYDIFSL